MNPRRIRGLLLTVALTQAWLFSGGANGIEPTVTDKSPRTGKVPDGMVWIPDGEFSMGAVVNGHGTGEMPMPSNDAEPVHRVRVDGFWMDKTTVTNDAFDKFVKANGYVTIAERLPTREEF